MACSWALAAGAGDDDHVGADLLSGVAHGAHAVGARHVDVGHPLIAEDFAGEREPVWRGLEQEDVTGPLQTRERGVRGADRAGADHRNDVVESDGDVLVTAHGIRQWIGERRHIVGQAVGNAEEVLERDLGDGHELGVGALVVKAHQLVAHAQMLVAAQAQTAASAPQGRDAVEVVARPRNRPDRSPRSRSGPISISSPLIS